LRTKAREALARYLGADADEVALVRNTSEGNNMVLNGIPLGPGDEVVIWDQNHPTNNISWDVKAARYGFRVRRVTTPRDPQDADELIAPFVATFTPRTRVVAFSHISNVSGMVIDAAELCRRASDRGILTLVDGAQAFGVAELDLHAMGCDFYTGSAHKWFVGPKEAGILYVRRERVADLWACNTGVGWEGALRRGAEKFENLGQRDDATVAAMGTTVDFHESIGPRRIEMRARDLVTALMDGLAERVPGVRFHTPSRPELRAGVLVFQIEGREPRPVFEELYAQHRIAGAGMGGDFAGVRFSPHLYNTMEEVERAVSAVARIVGA
jgi:selenocysteine lyase/cysteine desulfurase